MDAEYARTLAELETTDRLNVTRAMWADAAVDTAAVTGAMDDVLDDSRIPDGQTPTENRDWWAGLEPRERDALLALFPEHIGALDGLPAGIRDTANRGLLEMEYARISDELAQHLASEPTQVDATGVHRRGVLADGEIRSPEWPAWNAERERLEAVLGGMRSIQNRFDQTGIDGLPEAYLLGFGTEADGRAIIANGNPDTAQHTAVYVPGTSADLPGIEGDIARMTDLWRATDERAQGADVSTITWLGYDAPDTIVPDAASRSYADEAAPALNSFVDGLHAARQDGDAGHTTLVGHSYGSTVIGAAALERPLRVDEVIVAGSPGMLVERAEELGVGSDHVWSMAAGVLHDPVPLAALIHGWDPVDIHFSQSGVPSATIDLSPSAPSMESFGANIMATDSDDHSGYWDVEEDNGKDSTSLKNQAWVVLGRYDQVELAAGEAK
ncbi:hypothetical protein E1265_17440 [Streptomyces sp. 8K308]|uniref:alpha/beta hydrolase n=1 Tax=Streptomyces sp. 8K308 TaxID=2530388 RepID=UPI001053BFCD|nr:alpha/beta hydrolase [Streptomyces sp. 8K308]TDC21667.1 hypothetical protein E1265_17440 [Streptomyces sp. 8K308]